jgi:alpha-1,2-mannosyltransferase
MASTAGACMTTIVTVTGLLVSPISWTHHWVWAVPLLVSLTTTAWRRRSAAWALAPAGAAVVFSDYTPLPWPGHPADPARMAASDLYVLAGLAVLAAVGVALTRKRPVRPERIRPERDRCATGGP